MSLDFVPRFLFWTTFNETWPISVAYHVMFFYFPYKVISLVSAHGFDFTASETTKDGKQGKNRKPLSLSSFDKRIKLLFQTRRERLPGFVLKWWLDKHVELNRFFSISPVGKQHKVCVLFINAGGLDRTPFVWIGIHSETVLKKRRFSVKPISPKELNLILYQ